MIMAMKCEYRNDGKHMVIGHLLYCGILLQRSRIRSFIHSMDPLSTLIRSVAIRRCVYHVEGPNCVWHIHSVGNKIQSDFGGENVDIWWYMVEQRRSSFAITGLSTHHDVRIKRIWRDVFLCVTSLFNDVFYS